VEDVVAIKPPRNIQDAFGARQEGGLSSKKSHRRNYQPIILGPGDEDVAGSGTAPRWNVHFHAEMLSNLAASWQNQWSSRRTARGMKEIRNTRMNQRVITLLAAVTILAMLSGPLCLSLCMGVACPSPFPAQHSQEAACHGGGAYLSATATFLSAFKRCGQGELPAVRRQLVKQARDNSLQREKIAKNGAVGPQSFSTFQYLGAEYREDWSAPPPLSHSTRTTHLRI